MNRALMKFLMQSFFAAGIVWMAMLAQAQGGAATRPATQPATQPALPAGSRINLNLDNVKPSEAFAQLSKQIDYDLRPSPRNLWDARPWPDVSVELRDASFWQATRELCEKSGVSLQRLGIERDIVLMAGGGRPWLSYPAYEHGPFLVVAQSLQRVNSIDLTNNTSPTRSCYVRMMLYGEPKIRVLRAAAMAQIDHAVDERGNSLAPAVTASQPRPSFTTGWTWSVVGQLSPPAEAGTTIAELRGRIQVAVQSASQIVRIPDIQTAGRVTQTVRGHRLTIKELRKTGSTYVVSMTLVRDPADAAGPAAGTARDVSPGSFFKLLDASGEPLSRRSYGGTGGGAGDSVELSLTFAREAFNGGDAAGEPATLVWEVPTQVTEYSIPFVFRDIPLP